MLLWGRFAAVRWQEMQIARYRNQLWQCFAHQRRLCFYVQRILMCSGALLNTTSAIEIG